MSVLTLMFCFQLKCCGLQKIMARWKQLSDHINFMIRLSILCMGLSGWLMKRLSYTVENVLKEKIYYCYIYYCLITFCNAGY